jgi:hypothetical protein
VYSSEEEDECDIEELKDECDIAEAEDECNEHSD